MAGKIFINYRRGDDPGYTQALFGKLEGTFAREQLFMDVDNIPAGMDFVRYLDEQVAACDVLLAVIGPHWLSAADEKGARRLEQPGDFVRIEVGSALRQDKRVIPVLVNNAQMPRAEELPEDLKPLARRHAVRITHERFKPDAEGLVRQVTAALDEADAARARLLDAARQATAEADRARQVAAEQARTEVARAAEEADRRRQDEARLKAIAGLSPEQIAKAEELANWEFVKDSPRVEDFRDHLARFPKGVAERMARAKLEALVWAGISPMREAVGVSDPAAYTAYLEEFPDGPNASAARAQLAEVKRFGEETRARAELSAQEQAAWTAALEAGSIGAVEAFIAKWPKSVLVRKARERINELARSSAAIAEVQQWPVAAATLFAAGSLPLCIGGGYVGLAASPSGLFGTPGQQGISIEDRAVMSGLSVVGLLLLLFAVVYVAIRRQKMSSLEFALFWLGCVAVVCFDAGFLYAFFNSWQVGTPGVMAATTLAFGTAGLIAYLRRKVLTGGEIGVYWLGCVWLLSVCAGMGFSTSYVNAIDAARYLMLAGLLAATTTLALGLLRRTWLTGLELALYWLSFTGPLLLAAVVTYWSFPADTIVSNSALQVAYASLAACFAIGVGLRVWWRRRTLGTQNATLITQETVASRH